MKCLIILNGKSKDECFLKKLAAEHDYIICADGGYTYANKCGIKPNLVVGDFDSCDMPVGENAIKYPVQKDVTDCEIAIEKAMQRGFKNITLTCALGGRTDHQLANMLLCISYFGQADIVINEHDTVIMPLYGRRYIGEYLGKTFSIIPISPSVITIEGVYYPLEKRSIKPGTTLTVSNVITDKNAAAELESGAALLIINKNI